MKRVPSGEPHTERPPENSQHAKMCLFAHLHLLHACTQCNNELIYQSLFIFLLLRSAYPF
jgi:hypothetical protein